MRVVLSINPLERNKLFNQAIELIQNDLIICKVTFGEIPVITLSHVQDIRYVLDNLFNFGEYAIKAKVLHITYYNDNITFHGE